MWADLTIEPTLDEHLDGIAINISERKIREELVQKHAIELKEEVDRKTRKLQNSIVELEKAQTQILQQSRLVTIGNLVSGVAHEIGNPLNLVVGVERMEELVDELHSMQNVSEEMREALAERNLLSI